MSIVITLRCRASVYSAACQPWHACHRLPTPGIELERVRRVGVRESGESEVRRRAMSVPTFSPAFLGISEILFTSQAQRAEGLIGW